MSQPVVVVGAGSWGTAFAATIAGAGHPVRLLARDSAVANAIASAGQNPRYLKGIDLPPMEFAASGSEAVTDARMVVLAVPSRAVVKVAGEIAPGLDTKTGVVSLSKGLDPETGERLSVALGRALAGSPLAVLTGPSHAEEVAIGRPTAVVVGGDDGLARLVQELTTGTSLRVYRNDDIVGLEIAAAAKNVVALAAGMADGLGTGDNAKAALITRGLAEMTRLGTGLGAREATFGGLAGMGDLVATCTSSLSRNRRAGEMIATGTPPDEVEAALGQVAEGLLTVKNLLRMAEKAEVELPISSQVDAVVSGRVSVGQALETLMSRAPSAE